MGRANVGGPALQAVVLQRGLVPPEFETMLVVGRMAHGEEDYLQLRAPDVDHVMMGWGGRLPAFSDAFAFIRLLLLTRRFKPDIMHTHTAKAGVLGRIVAIVCRVPIRVHTFHGHLLRGYFRPWLTKAIVTMERVLASRTTCLVAVGEKVRDELLAAGIGTPDQFQVVPPGVPLEQLLVLEPGETAVRDELRIDHGAPVVGFLGRLVAIKRIDRLVDIIREIATADPDVEFIVVGDGPERSRLEELRSQLGRRLHLLGWRGDVAAVLGAMDVVVNTSENEGMPVALIEAGAAGKPVVATDVGSTAEVVSPTVSGFVLPYELEAFVGHTLRLLSDSELRAKMGARGRELSVAQFGEARLAGDMAHTYRRLVNDRGRTR
jgi:glycosyltransferase involved in cell wall biosynthesis